MLEEFDELLVFVSEDDFGVDKPEIDLPVWALSEIDMPKPEGFVARVSAAVDAQVRCPKGVRTGGQFTGLFASNCEVSKEDANDISVALSDGEATVDQMNPAELLAVSKMYEDFDVHTHSDFSGFYRQMTDRLNGLTATEAAFVPGPETGDPARDLPTDPDDKFYTVAGSFPEEVSALPLAEKPYGELLREYSVASADKESDRFAAALAEVNLRKEARDVLLGSVADSLTTKLKSLMSPSIEGDKRIDLELSENRWSHNLRMALLETTERFAETYPKAMEMLVDLSIEDFEDRKQGAARLIVSPLFGPMTSVQISPTTPWTQNNLGLVSSKDRISWIAAHELAHIAHYQYAANVLRAEPGGLTSATPADLYEVVKGSGQRFERLYEQGSPSVSDYGSTNSIEFFAEAFAAEFTGLVTVDDNVSDAVREFMEQFK